MGQAQHPSEVLSHTRHLDTLPVIRWQTALVLAGRGRSKRCRNIAMEADKFHLQEETEEMLKERFSGVHLLACAVREVSNG